MKDIVGFQAQIGDRKKVVVVDVQLMTAVIAKSIRCVLVECSNGDVSYSEGLLKDANWGIE